MSTLSYWEREELLRSDVIIIGAGIIGLSTSLSIRERDPNFSITVLERGILPRGASTRNAGFACYGSITEMLRDIATKGADATISVVEQRRRGLDLLRSRLGHDRIGYEACGGYELLVGSHANAVERLGEINALMKPLFGETYYEQCDHLISEFGFAAERVPHMIRMRREGCINPGMMMRNLAALAVERGVRLITGADVLDVAEESDEVRVRVRRPDTHDTLEFTAARVVVCTNALAPQLMPTLHFKPARGQVLITHPLKSPPFRGVFHFDEGYYYFRNVGNCILFGGGRNTDFEGETTNEFAITESIQSNLENYLREVIIPHSDFSVDTRWSGIMGFSDSGKPVVEKISDRIIVAFGCNGMGIALGSSVGAEAGEMVVGEG